MNNDIDNYLNKLNWKFERINESTIVSGFKGNTTSFTLYIYDADEWVILLTYANLLPIPDEKRNEVINAITKLNFETPIVKFSCDDNSNIVVSVELYKNSINENSLEVSLDSLCSSAENLFDQLTDLQNNLRI
jgi:hypothetical protein